MKFQLKDLLWHYDGTPTGPVTLRRETSNNAVFYVEPGTSLEINKFCAVQ
ncbi:hypothetical protein [Myxococcus sp. RHSTA-1-4]|nr:hypothetical protein [Myxococcus sp. RHSTA-1-4]MBZ4419712.1 hypothetical protein [Myxococcus sp. RHSTA-1-4]